MRKFILSILLTTPVFSSELPHAPVVKDTVFYSRGTAENVIPLFLKQKATKIAKNNILKECGQNFSSQECLKNLTFKTLKTSSTGDGECGLPSGCTRVSVFMIGELRSRPLIRNVLLSRDIKGSYACQKIHYAHTTKQTYVSVKASYDIKFVYKAIENPVFMKRDNRHYDIISQENYHGLEIEGIRYDSDGGGLVPAPVMIRDDGKSDLPGSTWERNRTFESDSSYGLSRSFVKEVASLTMADVACRELENKMQKHIERMEAKYTYQELPDDMKDILSPLAHY